MDVEMKLLRVFSAVVECESFTGAEVLLGMSQSSISVAMSQLESRIGMRLCERGRSGFQLTEAGQIVHRSTQRLFGAVEEFKANTGVLRGRLRGNLHLGIIDNTITDPNSPVCIAIEKFDRRAENDIQIDIIIESPIELQKRVLDGRLHVGIGPFRNRVSGLVYTHLYDEGLLLYCGRSHPLFDQHSHARSIGAFRDSRLVSRSGLNNDDLKAMGLKGPATTVDNVEAQTILILSGAYIGFLPKHFAAKWVLTDELRPLLKEKLERVSQFEMIVRKTTLRMPNVKAFIDCLAAATSPRIMSLNECRNPNVNF